MEYTQGAYLNAMALLEDAGRHVASQFRTAMTRDELLCHVQTRELLLRHRIALHNEAVEAFGIAVLPITQADVDEAMKAVR